LLVNLWETRPSIDARDVGARLELERGGWLIGNLGAAGSVMDAREVGAQVRLERAEGAGICWAASPVIDAGDV
jgi:hypothetical protein